MASPMSTRLTRYLQGQPKPWLWLEAIALIIFFGCIDFLTGYDMTFFLFYAIPILLMVRFAGRAEAIIAALLCSVAWFIVDSAAGHPYRHTMLQAWEVGMRVCFFFLVVIGGSAVKARIELLEHSQQLEKELIRISEREQQRIGQDLHDGLCQYFAAVGCAAGSLRRSLETEHSPSVVGAAEIEELIMDGVGQARSLARGLSPVNDDDAGLQSALEELTANTSRLLNLRCSFQCDQFVAVHDNARATHLFRIAQEAINNATRHGRATEATVSLRANDGCVTLSVVDNGIGLPAQLPEKRGLGLSIMRFRARTIGAKLDIMANERGGTSVVCSMAPETQLEAAV
jgi:signal transduction histidine kinase